MNRTRWMVAGAAVTVLALAGVAYGFTGGASDSSGDSQALPTGSHTTTTSKAVTTTSEASTTTTSSSSPPTTVADTALKQGSKGAAVTALQQRLTDLHLDPGPADGSFGLATFYAVEAFQKLNGMRPDGRVGSEVQAALANPAAVTALVPNGGADRLEIDLRRQLLVLYQGGNVRLISHVSTGSGKKYCAEGDCNNTAITPIGSFRFAWRYQGWRQSRLGKLYNPVYFTNDGVAVHGALSVPAYPASHGCVRIPMHIAEYFPSLVKRGDPVYVTDGRPVGPPQATPSGPPPPDKPTTQGDDTPTPTTPPSSAPPTTKAPTTTSPPTTEAPPTTTSTTTSTTLVPAAGH